MLFIFDLDDTTINSQHRQGETLADWIANNTPENVAKDSLLPLADSWKTIDQSRDIVVILTSRVIADADLAFLARFGLRYRFIYSRPMGSQISCGQLKAAMVRQCARDLGWSLARLTKQAYMFDDSGEVRESLTAMGVRCYNPISYNARNAQ